MNVVTIQQSPKYSVSWSKILLQLVFLSAQAQSLFGALGGGLSLYLGCAVVMIFEVIELLIDLALAFICGSSDGKVNFFFRNSISEPFQAKLSKTGPMG